MVKPHKCSWIVLLLLLYRKTAGLSLMYWHIHFQTDDLEYFFIDKATE